MREIPINGRLNGGVAEMINANMFLSPHTTNITTCAIFMIIHSNLFMYDKVLEIGEFVKKDKLYKGSLKMRIEELLRYVERRSNEIGNLIVKDLPIDHSFGLEDMQTEIYKQISPRFVELEDEILSVLRDEHNLENANFISLVMSMDTAIMMANQTCSDILYSVPSLNNRISHLDPSIAYKKSNKMVYELQRILPKGFYVNLNKEIKCMAIIRSILKMMRDAELFSKAFKAGGFSLEYEERESLPSGPYK